MECADCSCNRGKPVSFDQNDHCGVFILLVGDGQSVQCYQSDADMDEQQPCCSDVQRGYGERAQCGHCCDNGYGAQWDICVVYCNGYAASAA